MARHSARGPRSTAIRATQPPERQPGLSLTNIEALLDLVPIGALLCQDDYVRLNRRGAEMVGLAAQRLPSGADRSALEFSAGGRRLAPEEHPIERVLRSGIAIHDETLSLVRADGGEIHVLLSVWPMSAADGAVSGAIATFREMTSTESPLVENTAGHLEQLASLGALAAGIAHEINNPLNSIMVNAELGLLALDRDGGHTKAREVLETIVRDVKRCGSITHSVLQLSNTEDSVRESCDLNDVVRQACELVAATLRMHDARVELDLAELPPLLLNATAMEHAVMNLLRNAAEAGSGRHVTIRVRTQRAEANVSLSVSDDGPGIAAEHLDRVFTPLFSRRKHRDGSGLGLSLVHRAVTSHGGTIRVQSKPGEGTKFVVELPNESADDATGADR
jgi:signal transduction histidine kinase